MRNDLVEELNAIENEIHALKDAYLLVASGLATKTIDVGTFNFPLTLGMGEAYCAQALKITLETIDSTNQICNLTLKPVESASGYDMKQRTVSVWQKTSVGNKTEYILAVGSLNAADIATLSGGGSVTLKYKFSATGTSNFNASAEWINL